ncbi:unnamed protein product [Heterobilharzia americana]|nr:unnamed protein product [Heterobilharzia americana]
MSSRWNIFIESIPNHDNSVRSSPVESQKVIPVSNRIRDYDDEYQSSTVYPVSSRPVLRSVNESPSYRQTSNESDSRPANIIRYVSMSKIPSTEDKYCQTLTDEQLERQYALSNQANSNSNIPYSSNFANSRNRRQYQSVNSFSPYKSEWREPIQSSMIVPVRSSSKPSARKDDFSTRSDHDSRMGRNTDLLEPEICIKSKLAQGTKHYICITHGRDSP